jgi:hypothetical protein
VFAAHILAAALILRYSATASCLLDTGTLGGSSPTMRPEDQRVQQNFLMLEPSIQLLTIVTHAFSSRATQ